MRILLLLALAFVPALPALSQDGKKDEKADKEKEEKKGPAPLDLAKILRESKEFKATLAKYRMSFQDGIVRAVGEIAYRGGGPCEYLVNVFPAKAHETIVLLDNGPWKKEERRDRKELQGLATNLNNALIAAGFKKGKHFDWSREDGTVYPPKGEVVHIYAEWKTDEGKTERAHMADWLWNFKLLEVMQPGKFVYTGSLMIDEGPPRHKKWFGAEVEGLVVGVLNTSTVLIDNTEEGSLDNGAYGAIPDRVPEIGTRVTVIFSKKPLEGVKKYKPLEIPDEIKEERKRRAEARKKAAEEKKKADAAKKKEEEKKEKDADK